MYQSNFSLAVEPIENQNSSAVDLNDDSIAKELNFDRILTDLVGTCGLWQWSLIAIGILTVPPTATFPVFANSEPAHRCRMEPVTEAYFKQQNVSFELIARVSEPQTRSGCARQKTDWTNLTWVEHLLYNQANVTTDELEPCLFGYVYKFKSNQYPGGVVAEFDTVCEYHWLTPLSTSLYILGMLLGFLSGGWFSDRFGRKRTIIGYAMVEILAGLTVSLAPNYTAYAIARTIIACAVTGKIIAMTVLQMEITVANRRSFLNATSTLGHNFFNRGLLALYAFLIPNWRLLNAAIIAPIVFSVLLLWIPESPRWLYSQKRNVEAVEVLINGYRLNNRTHVDSNVIDQLRSFGKSDAHSSPKACRKRFLCCTSTSSPRSNSSICTKAALLPFIKTASMGGLIFAGNVFCYFGLIFYARITDLPVYLTAFINSLTAIPGTLIFALLYRFFRWRKPPLIGLYVTASVILITGAVYNYFGNVGTDVVLTVCANFALTLLGSSLSMLYVFIPELFPSAIRTQGLGFASGMGRIGGFWCSFVNHFHRSLSAGFPLLVYGIILLLTSGIVLFIGDTDGENLADFVVPDKRKRDIDTSL